MKLGIIADTHDNLVSINIAVECFNRLEVDYVLHAGDYVAPFTLDVFSRLKAKFIGVWGNNDGERIILLDKAHEFGFKLHESPYHFKLADKDILLMHEPYEINALIKSNCYDLIVYGHLHRIDLRQVGSTMIINPGECSGWLTKKSSIAVLDVDLWEAHIIDI